RTQRRLALHTNYLLVSSAFVKVELHSLTLPVFPARRSSEPYGSSDPALTYGSAPALIGSDSFTGALARDAGSNVGLYNIIQGTLDRRTNCTLAITAAVTFEVKTLTVNVTPDSGQLKT